MKKQSAHGGLTSIQVWCGHLEDCVRGHLQRVLHTLLKDEVPGWCRAPLLSSGHELSAVAELLFDQPGVRYRSVICKYRVLSHLIPVTSGLFQFQRTGPFAEPEEFFCERPHQPFCIGVVLGVVVTGERLRDTQAAQAFRKATGFAC